MKTNFAADAASLGAITAWVGISRLDCGLIPAEHSVWFGIARARGLVFPALKPAKRKTAKTSSRKLKPKKPRANVTKSGALVILTHMPVTVEMHGQSEGTRTWLNVTIDGVAQILASPPLGSEQRVIKMIEKHGASWWEHIPEEWES